MQAATELVERGKPGRQPTVTTFHAEVENGEGIIGYQYLHGTKKPVGDFRIVGWGQVTRFQQPHRAVVPSRNPFLRVGVVDRGPGAQVDLELTYVWNDIIAANSHYISDEIKSALAYVFTAGKSASYRISIGWRDSCSVWLPDAGGQQLTGGYPAT